MKLSDTAIRLLMSYARRQLVRGLHPEDVEVYKQGLEDGQTILAQELLDQLKPEEPAIPSTTEETNA